MTPTQTACVIVLIGLVLAGLGVAAAVWLYAGRG